eukprot:TRINITY_DN10516_c0_g2_i2.p2 TRINITY_DN10516_c0_g2~~TRINITY_DN10516_c0_g2_i2.p2  ORF type:complete len:191 (+),score=14.49 TRINITY_DN10516_c0_g2_i2:185-757(+)
MNGAVVPQVEKLTPETIDKYMPMIQYKNRANKDNAQKGQNDNCAVCLVEFEQNSECRETICWHIFHKECLDSWLTKHENCPYCRSSLSCEDLKSNELHPKQCPKMNQSSPNKQDSDKRKQQRAEQLQYYNANQAEQNEEDVQNIQHQDQSVDNLLPQVISVRSARNGGIERQRPNRNYNGQLQMDRIQYQ